jgi:hypothetical protein
MRLRVLVVPKLHHTRELRIQVWHPSGFWNTMGKLSVTGEDYVTVLDIFRAGAKAQGVACEVTAQRRQAA